MKDNTVSIDTSVSPADIAFSKQFNVAVPFIDRHLEEGRGDKVVIQLHEGGAVTYATLAEHVNRAGNALLGLGIRPRDRVLMMIKDAPEFYFTYWGAIKAGILPVPLNTLLRAKDYSYMIENSQAAGVIYSPEFSLEVDQSLETASHKPAIALRTEGHGDTFAKHMASASTDLQPAKVSPEDDAFWLYSSGSTGNPKGVVHAHKDMVITSQRYAVETLQMTEDDINFSAAKLFFAYGLGNAMTFPLWVGGSAVLFAAAPTPAAMHEIIEKYRPTIYYGVPTLYAAQLRAMGGEEVDLSSIRLFISAGEALPPDLLRRWTEKTGTEILDGIGIYQNLMQLRLRDGRFSE